MRGALSTDLYELTMAAGYHAAADDTVASFELFVRELPVDRAYLVSAGLEEALDFLCDWHFTADDIAYLRSVPGLSGASSDFFDVFLPGLRFTGDVWAVTEGLPVFAGEPLLRVRAPLVEAQLVETALLAIILFQTSVASKASRVIQAAAGRSVIEFGARRAHGLDAGVYAARAAYLAGCEATSNVDAGHRFSIPVSGTMAHSWVMAHDDELTAFTRYCAVHGPRSVLVIDTYDTLAAARRIVSAGLRPAAVRVDSGDLAGLSGAVRGIFDGGGLRQTKIFVSGDLDEHRIDTLIAAGAPIDGFGVGTAVTTSADAPSLSGVYKLVEVVRNGTTVPVAKLTPGKRTLPGAKQVWRVSEAGKARRDVMGMFDELGPPQGTPLLRRVMRDGRLTDPSSPLDAIRDRCRYEVAALPAGVRRLLDAERFPVELSAALDRLSCRVSGPDDHPV